MVTTIWNNYKPTYFYVAKKTIFCWFTLYKPTQNVIISEETPPHPLCGYKSAR